MWNSGVIKHIAMPGRHIFMSDDKTKKFRFQKIRQIRSDRRGRNKDVHVLEDRIKTFRCLKIGQRASGPRE